MGLLGIIYSCDQKIVFDCDGKMLFGCDCFCLSQPATPYTMRLTFSGITPCNSDVVINSLPYVDIIRTNWFIASMSLGFGSATYYSPYGTKNLLFYAYVRCAGDNSRTLTVTLFASDNPLFPSSYTFFYAEMCLLGTANSTRTAGNCSALSLGYGGAVTAEVL